jgi:YidC/Oxa1 family membrane protein insertase
MDKNTIIGFVLIGLILIFWPIYQNKVVGVKPSDGIVQQTTETVSPTISPDRTVSKPVQPALSSTPLVNQDKEETKPDTVFLENKMFRAAFSSLGGGTVLSWKLKGYDRHEKDKLTGEDEKIPIDLIPDSGREDNLGFRLTLPDGSEQDLSKSVFAVEYAAEQSLKFVKDIPGKGRIVKEILASPDRYDVDVHIRFIPEIENTGRISARVIWNTGLAFTEKNASDETSYQQAFALQGGELLKEKKGDTGNREGSTDWMAIRSKYFAMALIPQNQPGDAVQLTAKDGVKIQDYYGATTTRKDFSGLIQMKSSAETEAVSYKLFLGPLDYELLKSYDVHLEKTMDFGWAIIRIFSIPLYYALAFFGKTLHNYGWAIIILSILIKIVLYPLTRKSYQSMREMQALQPKINTLREKYAKDPQRLNQETMKLYKEHGVNPMGGCLPMLLQMPVLFALFGLFRSTIMFRHAAFGPIQDLSAPDALIHFGSSGIHILPILMGVTTFFQQKQTVQDPKQKMMAYFMPIFLTFIFYKMSAGLNLYYLVFNVLTIAQEFIVKRPKNVEA